jgi:hypothetical protein
MNPESSMTDILTKSHQTTLSVTKPTLLQKRRDLRDAEIKFCKASKQLAQTNQMLADLSRRYNAAKKDDNRCFRDNLMRKISVMQGARSMYYDYVYMKAEEINMLRHEVRSWVEVEDSTEYETELDNEE